MNVLINEELLERLFSPYGNVIDCVVKQYSVMPDTGKQCGYGFVFFVDMAAVDAAIKGTKDVLVENIHFDCALSHDSSTRMHPHSRFHHHAQEVVNTVSASSSTDGTTNSDASQGNNGLSGLRPYPSNSSPPNMSPTAVSPIAGVPPPFGFYPMPATAMSMMQSPYPHAPMMYHANMGKGVPMGFAPLAIPAPLALPMGFAPTLSNNSSPQNVISSAKKTEGAENKKQEPSAETSAPEAKTTTVHQVSPPIYPTAPGLSPEQQSMGSPEGFVLPQQFGYAVMPPHFQQQQMLAPYPMMPQHFVPPPSAQMTGSAAGFYSTQQHHAQMMLYHQQQLMQQQYFQKPPPLQMPSSGHAAGYQQQHQRSSYNQRNGQHHHAKTFSNNYHQNQHHNRGGSPSSLLQQQPAHPFPQFVAVTTMDSTHVPSS